MHAHYTNDIIVSEQKLFINDQHNYIVDEKKSALCGDIPEILLRTLQV